MLQSAWKTVEGYKEAIMSRVVVPTNEVYLANVSPGRFLRDNDLMAMMAPFQGVCPGSIPGCRNFDKKGLEEADAFCKKKSVASSPESSLSSYPFFSLFFPLAFACAKTYSTDYY